MSHRRQTLDSFINYEPAGIKTQFLNESAASCIRPSIQKPITPEALKRFRRSYRKPEGKTMIHYGKANDITPPPSFAYGKKSSLSSHVSDILKNSAIKGIKSYIEELKEANYSSNKREPLGQGIKRNYKWPEKILNKNFAFGAPTTSDESAKGFLYTHPDTIEDERTRELYKISHGRYDAGEQKRRNYTWSFSPEKHVFGKRGNSVTNETKWLLQPEIAEGSFPKTVITRKNVEDFKDYTSHALGRAKKFGQTNIYINPDHVYGYKRVDKNGWDAGKCISGEPTFKEVAPDQDLGRSVKCGNKNIPHPGDERRTFGVPNIRTDIRRPRHKSVANQNNYGDEPEAKSLVFPQKFHEMGIGRKDFEMKRSKEEIRRLFSNIGYSYKPGKFEGLFMRAQELDGVCEDFVSVDSFIRAVKEMDHIN